MRRRDPTGSHRGRRWAGDLVVAAVLAAAAGCGVAAQSEPEAVTASPISAATPSRPRSTGVVQVYLVRDGHLVPVSRAGRSAADGLSALSSGPTSTDVEVELHSPLPALPVAVVAQRDPDLVTIDVPAEFGLLPPRDRFLAAAQLVWTATAVCCATQVRLLFDDRPLPVPTDRGPTIEPVRREDYTSAAPL